MPTKTNSQSSIKTKESKTSSSSSKGSSHSSKKSTSSSKSKPEQKETSKVASSSKLKPEQKETSKVTSSSKLKPEQKDSTKVKSKTSSLTKSSSPSKNVKSDIINKNSVNTSKSKSSTPSNKSSKISSSSNVASGKKSSSTSKSSSGKSTLESSGSKKLEPPIKKEHLSPRKDENSKSEKRKVNSKESHEKGSKSTKEGSKTPSKSISHNSLRKNSVDATKSKKHDDKTKSEKHSKSNEIDEKIEKRKPEKTEKANKEKTEKVKPEKSDKSKSEKTEKTKSEKTEKTKTEKTEKPKPEKAEKKTEAEKIEIAKPENNKKMESDSIENTKELEKLTKNEDSAIKEKGEIDRIEKPIETDKEVIGKDVPEIINTSVNLNDSSLDTMESGISMTSPNELSDGEVEESISSRFVEVDEMDYPSAPSSINLHSSSQPPRNDLKLEGEEEYNDQEKGMKEDNEFMDYEDDFENYESDFEDDDDDNDDDDDDDDDDESDSEYDEEEENEEKSEDDDDEESDSDENVEADKGYKDLKEPDPQMLAVLMALEKENSRPKTRASQNAQEETNHQDKETGQETFPKSSKNRPKTSRAFVNFNRAKERAKGEKASEKMKNRGQIILEMIQLDTISIDLFIQVSDSYESYIASFGTTNTLQTSTQTNDDAISEEVQTESLTLLNKWTQKPINISVKKDYLPTPQDFLGVGGDSVQEDEEENALTSFKPFSVDSGHLTKFLSASSQVVLMLLEEESVFKNDSLGYEDNEDLGFSKTGIDLGSGMNSLLKGRKATFVSFCSSDPLMVVTGHSFQDPNNNATGFVSKEKRNSKLEDDEEDSEAQNEEPEPKEDTSNVSFYEKGAFLCVWSIRQPSFPQRILICHSTPKVACFSPGRPIALVAGLTDGSLAAWDFRESLANHPMTVSFGDDKKWRLSPPSFITACHKEGFLGGSEIVAIEAVGNHEDRTDNFGSFQVVSLSALGQLTWWVIVQGEIQPMKIMDIISTGVVTEHGAAPWSRIIISRAASLSIDDMLPQSEDEFPGSNLCYDLKLSNSDSNQIYVAISNGRVLHCSRHNIKLHPSSFIPEIEPGTEAISISICPHDPLYLLVGGNDGLIRLHSITSPSPLTCWQASNNPAPVRKVEWSPSRPCVFYMLDDLGMFHIWDLSAGDIYPIISVEKGELMDGDLIDFNIASSSADVNQPLHAVFASESGTVSIRSVSSQFLRSSEEEYRNELERFRCYVSII